MQKASLFEVRSHKQMFSLQERPNLSEALDIFKAKMSRMGISLSKSFKDSAYQVHISGNGQLQTHRGVGRVLSHFLSYCYEEHIDFDHNGKVTTSDTYERPVLDKHDGIVIMFNQWQSICLQKENI